MQRLRITLIDGDAWTREVDAPRLDVGRHASNHIVLPNPAVSSEHCLLEFDGVGCVVKDRGSSNGTYLNNERLDEPRPMREGDLLYVGPYLLELVSIAPDAARRSGSSSPFGPVIRMSGPRDERTRGDQRLVRWATEWDAQGRPKRLLLRGRALQRAIASARSAPPLLGASAVFAAFLKESRRATGRVRLARTSLVLGVLALGGVTSWAVLATDEAPEHVEQVEEVEATPAPDISAIERPTTTSDAVAEHWIDHEVIPAETLADIARRYDVPAANIARWNRLNPDAETIEVGRKLRIKPRLDPLPQQQIVYELDKAYDWRKLSERFGVPVQKLRVYNPELGVDLPAGTRVNVWIDPKPHDRRTKLLKVPEFDVRPDAISVGNPNDGRLENGIQMPQSDLYEMRAPNIMWGSSHTIEHLLTAIARFRQEIDFEGALVVADISRRGGGKIPPHKSHQAGRDVDIWMPTLKGVYQKSWLGRERKPMRNEIDWFATWALVRALIETGQVTHIFLEYELQEKVYRAAKLSGSTDEELERAMQWPRGPHASGILAHSSGHLSHIHVRFRCGPHDTQCVDGIRRSADEEHSHAEIE